MNGCQSSLRVTGGRLSGDMPANTLTPITGMARANVILAVITSCLSNQPLATLLDILTLAPSLLNIVSLPDVAWEAMKR